MNKTRIVEITRAFRHPLYKKVLHRRTKFYAHDEQNQSHAGDTVRIMETRPLSKLKRWTLVEVVKKAS
jgi:small subunit ribosomal protein S17